MNVNKSNVCLLVLCLGLIFNSNLALAEKWYSLSRHGEACFSLSSWQFESDEMSNNANKDMLISNISTPEQLAYNYQILGYEVELKDYRKVILDSINQALVSDPQLNKFMTLVNQLAPVEGVTKLMLFDGKEAGILTKSDYCKDKIADSIFE